MMAFDHQDALVWAWAALGAILVLIMLWDLLALRVERRVLRRLEAISGFSAANPEARRKAKVAEIDAHMARLRADRRTHTPRYRDLQRRRTALMEDAAQTRHISS